MSVAAGIVLLAFIFVLEREGERKLPWSAGKAMAKRQASGSFRAVFRGVNANFWTRTSLVVMFILLMDGLISGFCGALMPIAAVQLFGYSTQQWSQLVAVMGLIGAAVALSLGPMIDRFGGLQITPSAPAAWVPVSFSQARFVVQNAEQIWSRSKSRVLLLIAVSLATGHFLMPVNSSIFRN